MPFIFVLAQADSGSSSVYAYPLFFGLLTATISFLFWVYFRLREQRQQQVALGLLNDQAQREQQQREQVERQRQQEQAQAMLLLQKSEEEIANLNGQVLSKTEECSLLGQERSRLLADKKDLERHKDINPSSKKQIYNVAIIGIEGSGKTALLLRMIDPLVTDISNLVQTGLDETYDRLVTTTHNHQDSLRVEHVFRLHEWGGEHLVEAQRDMLKMCQRDVNVEKDGVVDLAGIQGIVFTVDLGNDKRDELGRRVGKQFFNQERIRSQVEEYFSPLKLPFLLNDTVLSRCQIVILFINKVDLLEGKLDDARRAAEQHYQNLILGLRKACGSTPVEVIIGSADADISLTRVYSSLVRGIMPESARRGNLGKAEQLKLPVAGSRLQAATPVRDKGGSRPPSAPAAAAAAVSAPASGQKAPPPAPAPTPSPPVQAAPPSATAVTTSTARPPSPANAPPAVPQPALSALH